MPEEELKEKHANLTGEAIEGHKEKKSRRQEFELSHSVGQNSVHSSEDSSQNRKGMALPFPPLSLTFNDIRYSVDMPEVIFFSMKLKYKNIRYSQDFLPDHIFLHAGDERARSDRRSFASFEGC